MSQQLRSIVPYTLEARLGSLVSPSELALLQRLLAFMPSDRVSSAEALEHVYFEPLHDPDDEPTWPPFADKDTDVDAAASSSSMPTATAAPPMTTATLAAPPATPPQTGKASAERWRKALWREVQAMKKPAQRTPKRNYDL